MVDKRRTIELLPAHLRTETLSKFFSATVDNLFQPADVEFITGYVGSKPAWYQPLRDFYLPQPTKAREDYQLAPTVISRDTQSGKITHALFYEDLIGQLRFQGALTDDHDRLFEQEYCSWSPPIDLDKLVNFTNYYWLPGGPEAIELLSPTDLLNNAAGNATFTYSGDVRYTATGEIENATLSFTSGMKIIPTADRTLDLNGRSFIVENVGVGIQLVEFSQVLNPGWDLTAWDDGVWDGTPGFDQKQYVTISRSSRDGNQWSSSNRWFHIEVIQQSRTITPDSYRLQARRPIIEFDGNMRLWKYGFLDRGPVDLVDATNPDFLGSVVGQSSYEIDGVMLKDGMRVLVIGDQNSSANNRIYRVSGQLQGAISLEMDDFHGNDGLPRPGDRVAVSLGSYQDKNLYFTGMAWSASGQQKTGQPPLFELYDVDGIAMDDPGVYEASTFAGSKVFAYVQDPGAALDAELNIPAKVDQFGDYVFENHLATDTISYTSGGRTVEYTGLLSASVDGQLVNSWYPSLDSSRQYIVNEFVVNGDDQYTIDQAPAVQVANTLPTIFATYRGFSGDEINLVNGVDYTVSGQVVSVSRQLEAGGRLIIKSWNNQPVGNITGYYEIPKNLSANPNNEEITVLSRSQFLEHFTQIIENQTGFTGNKLGVNNYRDTSRNRGLGLSILQHRAPMLKLALLNTIGMEDINTTMSPTDPILAMQYAQKSYQRFYNRFLQTLFNLSARGYSPTGATACDPLVIKSWITAALKQINIAKTPASPWANSGYGDVPGSYCSVQQANPNYVPASPARLGLTPAFHPVVYMDDSFTPPQMTIQTHDGSRIVMVDGNGDQLGGFLHNQTGTVLPEELTNPVAAAWLQFELDLYANLPAPYRNPDAKLVFDVREYSPGKWRTSDYTRNELIRLQRSSFDRWAVSAQVNYRANTAYKTGDEFTYNYRDMVDMQGQPVPGYWKGIYRWFYDTDRPHTHPWEMLGFSQEPEWWTEEYGPAPYTNGNLALWSDLRDGLIRRGQRQGINSAWSRPGLLSCIPVDSQGNLLPPHRAGCVSSLPDVYSSASEWEFGDGSPVESAWIYSQDYPFVLAQTGYLMKPARFVEYTWDTLRTTQINENTPMSQWIYVDTNSRRSSMEFYVHRENPSVLNTGVTIPNESNLTYFGSCGLQHWISEYVISQGLGVTAYFGNVIRGGDVLLAQRMAGYINSSSLRTMVDSFGEIGFNSQIIPAENVNTYLYRSTSIGESMYGGVIVEKVRAGWRLLGYDAIDQVFEIIPSNITGPKTTVVVANARVFEYQQGLNTVKRVPYGTILTSVQEVYDFLIGLGRFQQSQGWMFDQYSEDSNVILDWTQSAKEFLFWTQGSWENGNFIALSPSASSVKYSQDFGTIQYINATVTGSYPVVDRQGSPIPQQNLTVVREDGAITVRPTNSQGVFGLRIYRTTFEHAVFFDNTTAFGDLIYQPLYDLRQARIRMYAYRTNGWTGRVEAPGYFLTKNAVTNTWTMTSNLESTAADFQKYFNIERTKNYEEINPVNGAIVQKSTTLGSVDRQEISNLARHLIGYQDRKYLQNLLLEDSTQFEFYQGFIKQKGTRNTINRLLRNTAITPSSFDFYEEWMIRLAQYGATSLNNVVEFRLPQSLVSSDPQWIRLFSDNDSDYKGDDVIDIVPRDPLIITPPESYQDMLFAPRKSLQPDPATDLPTAGYVMLGETTWLVTNTQELYDLWSKQQSALVPVTVRDTVWQFITNDGSWMVWILDKAVSQIDITIPSQITGAPTVIATEGPHGLINGDIVVINGVLGAGLVNGTYTVRNTTTNTFQIDVSTFESGRGGELLVYRPLRFDNTFDRDSGEPPGGWREGDLTYVDQGTVPGAWTVYKRYQGGWLDYRQQVPRTDASLLVRSELFNSVSGALLSEFNYFDPIQGRIPGRADAEITFKTDYDPAKYNKGNNTGYALSSNESWGTAQLGQVWWDLSTARYIDYELGDDRYRLQHWGKIAPGTSIDIYEWIRSPIPPADWASYVAEGRSITDGGRSYIPSGSIRNPSNPSWSEVVEYASNGTGVTYYYFWVRNSSMPSFVPERRITTLNISNLITNPAYDDRPWYAAISGRSIIVGNIQNRLDGNRISQRITYASLPNEQNVYGEWELIREGDPLSPVSNRVWTKLKDSLVTIDGLGNDVPDYHLSAATRYGNEIRPRQTWFVDREAASKVFVDAFNTLIANSLTPMVDNSAMAGWLNYFTAAEPTPPAEGNWNYSVESLVQRDALVGEINPGENVLVGPESSTGGLWTIWQYTPAGLVPTWTLVRTQAYKTDRYWSYVDWYLPGYDATKTQTYIVETISEMTSIENPRIGQTCQVLNNGSNKWQIYSYSRTGWGLVAQQDGSIEILPLIYQWSQGNLGFDDAPFESLPFDGVPCTEFSNIIDGIRQAIYGAEDNLQINVLLFSCINYALSEQTQIDWAIKTSNIVLKGFDEPLVASRLLGPDNIDSIIGFVNEAKPYHAKIREFVSGRNSQDEASVGLVDFDRPPGSPYTDPGSGLLDQILYDTYQSWNNNYLTNPQLVRTMSATLLFDRISTPDLRGGWSKIWGVFGWNSALGQNFGAIDRIDAYYEPTEGMIPKVIADLMGGVVYKGMKLSGLGFEQQPGWGWIWDDIVGWDPEFYDVESYLDQIIHGGPVPHYDSAIGTGSQRLFPLGRDVVNPHDMVVWSDGSLRIYGVEWRVPTYAQSVDIVDGGSGYQVGDNLEIVGGSGLAPARVRVTAVSHGEITAVELIGRGSYNTVTRGPYSLEYPAAYPGLGSNALLSVNWFCGAIEFNTAPASSAEPNIFVLYAGSTFGEAPDGDGDTVYDGYQFVQPFVDENHPEELYPFRVRDTMMLDVNTTRAGGRPEIMTRVYRCDGVLDQFDLIVSPQNDSAVLVYLDGTVLTAGLGNDFVINYENSKIVLLSVPPAGSILHVSVIGTGGASRLVQDIFVNEPGSGYLPGDFILFASNIGQVPASCQVSRVFATEINMVSAGQGYVVNDLLILEENGGSQVPDMPTVLRITEVGTNGEIVSYSIENTGMWTAIPVGTPTWQSRVTPAQSAVFDIRWGIGEATVVGRGRYARVPLQPMVQAAPPGSGGTGATFNASFAGSVETYYFTGDGSTTDFYVMQPRNVTAEQLEINIDGQLVVPASMLSDGFRLAVAPAYGASIVVTTFTNAEWSRSVETVISIPPSGPVGYSYVLNDRPASTLPPYLPTLVRKNGNLMNPPAMQQFRGNGSTRQWPLDIDITGYTSLFVYQDQISLPGSVTSDPNDITPIPGAEWIINGSNQLVFAYSIPEDADIQVVAIKASDEYSINDITITFNSNAIAANDTIVVNTYNQDIDYEFHLEKFFYDIDGVLVLSKNVYDPNSVQLWIDGELQKPFVDYRVVESPATPPAWDVSSWDSTPWDLGVPDTTSVVTPAGPLAWDEYAWDDTAWDVGPTAYGISSNVFVSYMTGLPERPSIAWRTLVSDQGVKTIALDGARFTTCLDDVYTYSRNIEIEDHRTISMPAAGEIGYVYINSELIGFAEMRPVPTIQHPYRALLSGLQRNRMGTSGNPADAYNVQFYSGDGSERYFATEAFGQALGITVFVDEQFQRQGIDYTLVINPPSKPAGEYVYMTAAPLLGNRNVKIVSWNIDCLATTLNHVAGSRVIDAGTDVEFPTPYSWEPAPNGLQFNKTMQTSFLLAHQSSG